MPDSSGVCDWLSPVYSSGMSIMTPDRVSQLNQRLAVSGTITSFYFARILKIYRPRISHKIALHRKPESESLPLKMASIPREWSICARTYYTKCPHTYMNSKIEDIYIQGVRLKISRSMSKSTRQVGSFEEMKNVERIQISIWKSRYFPSEYLLPRTRTIPENSS